ncbi:MAG: HTH domain-containing protein [Clostridia bacterium]|nr:HTH domain-containing protein [Clostridia bacterium]MBQ3493599.1 HTH domain-containing protein [Clostridia bacterium]MBQ3596996.1 HTH domain-containing protein [Clostridia bacterium]
MKSTIERRQRIIEILNMRRSEKIENLAFEFDVTRRTIENDIQVLSCSYPIDTKTGPTGCVYVQDGFDLYERYLTAKQFEVLEELKGVATGEQVKVLETILRSFGRNGGVKK